LVAAFGGEVATSMQARNARRQRDFAFAQLSRAESVNDLNTFIFSEAGLDTNRDLLRRAEEVVRRGRGGTEANRVDLLIFLANNTSLENGPAEARRLFEDAYRLARGLQDRSTRARAACALGGFLARGTEFARAEALVQEGLRNLPMEPELMLDRSYCLLRGAFVSRSRGNSKEAIARIEAAMKLHNQAPFRPELQRLLALIDLGDAYRVDGKNREACVTFEQASAEISALGRDNTGLAGNLYHRWSRALSALGRPLEAEPLARRAMGQFGSGVDDETLPPFFLVHYARLMRDLGHLEDAARRAERAYARAQQTNEQRVITEALLLRLSVYRMLGDLSRTAEMISALEPRLRGVPPGNINFAVLRSEQSLIARQRGDPLAAMDLANQALSIAEVSARAGESGAALLPTLLMRCSDLKRELHRLDDAVGDARRALSLVQQTAQAGTFSSTLGEAWLALGRALQSQGQGEAARAALQSAAEHFAHALGPEHPQTRSLLGSVAAEPLRE
jgi:tetratricopeptide (TPR) repeat protein